MLALLERMVEQNERALALLEQIAAHHQAGPELATLQQLHLLNQHIGDERFNAARLHELAQAPPRRALRLAFPGSPKSIGHALKQLAKAGHLVNLGTDARPVYAICRSEIDKIAAVHPWR
jgi:hypothetical protein